MSTFSTSAFLKCFVIGDGAIGKTTMIEYYKTGKFSDEYIPTVFGNEVVELDINGNNVRMDIYDTHATEEESRILSYTETDVFILSYSSVDPTSLENVKLKWYPDSLKHGGGKENTNFILVATKIDLRDDPKVMEQLKERGEVPVQDTEGKAMMKELDLDGFFECSSKTGEGVKKVFHSAALSVLKKRGEKGERGEESTKCILM